MYHDYTSDIVVGTLIILAIIVLIFLALRALMLWYWKINHIVERLDQIIMELKGLRGGQEKTLDG